ncbi:hypothetical protein DICPUDRAFT_89291 [Dictyostelium purpureum]|uniref:Phosphatidylethanolamine N-methyltransferase n=1 Tax=Dictyostelium purpureum TaxID=5786 RepID=F0ZUV5_DICPU|nr:uncharacterized protein DICPUDRAFT_89291 [Dictyostelium purpureum]EGC32270.1 hypothetical protein DICPUDRAFT_89291 [Dictyostelium purpureum]|eukprot:XP_003291207.1 hypothetical protein DICPUDRAFT_89291 [Dictyostelium purpureum]
MEKLFTTDLIIAFIAIVLHVVNYNATAQFEYKTRTFTKIIGKQTIYYYAVYLVISALIRDHFINAAIDKDQNSLVLFPQEVAKFFGNSCFIFGILLNIWTLKALGIKGMYNGDSFGHLMDAPVTTGPYVYFSDPQYVGTTIAAIGAAIRYQSMTGYLCSILVGIVFYISATFVETPHLNKIYSNRSYSKINFKNFNKKNL